MSEEPRRLRVTPDSELALRLREADQSGSPLLIDTGDAIYSVYIGAPEVAREPTPADIARSREGIRRAAGSWKDVDVEEFKAYVYERRRASSRPPVRL